MENRKRPLRMIIRVDEQEKEIILERMKRTKQKDFSTFARHMITSY